MEKWSVTIEALQPISIAAMPDRETHWETTIIIPGSTLRGAVAEEWKNRIGFDHSLTSQLFQKGVWRDALPKGTKLVTADLFYSKQTQKEESILTHYTHKQLTSLRKNNDDTLLPKEQGFFNDQLVMNQAVSISISPSRNTARHGRLYSLSAIAEGTVFTTHVRLPREALQLLNEEEGDDISFTCYIGKKRSSGYGKVKITFQEIKMDKNEMRQEMINKIKDYNMRLGNEQFLNGTWYIMLVSISPMILLDRFLRYTAEIDWETHICVTAEQNKVFQKLLSQEKHFIASLGASAVHHGWNSAWNMPKQAEWVLKPGTIHLFKFTHLTQEEQEILVDLFIDLEQNGIGERREEGFGQVCVWIDEQIAADTNEIKMEFNEDVLKGTEQLASDTSTIKTEFNDDVLEKAEQFAEKIKNIIKKSQLYELQQYKEDEIVEQICGTKLDCYMEKRLNRKAKNGWKNKIEFDGTYETVGQHLRNIVSEWKESSLNEKAGKKAKDFLRYIIGYYDIYRHM